MGPECSSSQMSSPVAQKEGKRSVCERGEGGGGEGSEQGGRKAGSVCVCVWRGRGSEGVGGLEAQKPPEWSA